MWKATSPLEFRSIICNNWTWVTLSTLAWYPSHCCRLPCLCCRLTFGWGNPLGGSRFTQRHTHTHTHTHTHSQSRTGASPYHLHTTHHIWPYHSPHPPPHLFLSHILSPHLYLSLLRHLRSQIFNPLRSGDQDLLKVPSDTRIAPLLVMSQPSENNWSVQGLNPHHDMGFKLCWGMLRC